MRCNNEDQHIANNIEKKNQQKDLKHHKLPIPQNHGMGSFVMKMCNLQMCSTNSQHKQNNNTKAILKFEASTSWTSKTTKIK